MTWNQAHGGPERDDPVSDAAVTRKVVASAQGRVRHRLGAALAAVRRGRYEAPANPQPGVVNLNTLAHAFCHRIEQRSDVELRQAFHIGLSLMCAALATLAARVREREP